LGGETIYINELSYKVPKHIKQIWELINKSNAVDDGNQELSSFYDPTEDPETSKILGEVMTIADKATFNSHCFRHASTQQFYMNIVNSENFIHYLHESKQKELCQKIN